MPHPTLSGGSLLRCFRLPSHADSASAARIGSAAMGLRLRESVKADTLSHIPDMALVL